MFRNLFGKKGKHEIKVDILGLHCPHCEIHLEDKLRKLPGVTFVKVSHSNREAIICGDTLPDEQVIMDTIAGVGYKPKQINNIR